MYEDDEEQEEGPKSSFSTYLAEGDVLYKQGEYKKALDSYSLVIWTSLFTSLSLYCLSFYFIWSGLSLKYSHHF